ncbi:MAG: exonuclease SbcCD subunit D, partial [Candidatus Gallimonas sp.]
MKILHTSDWHVGKRLADRERLPEQEEALDEIAAICAREKVDLVLVAGDVFDTFMPSAEAEELFFRAVKKIAGQDRALVAV